MALGALPLSSRVEARTLSAVPKPAKSNRYYRPELDALRFLAFLFVLLRHGVAVDRAGWLQKHHPWVALGVAHVQGCGAFGLSLFFFLSSFLITTLLQLEVRKTGTVNLRSFYVRRMLRIWPLYFGFLACMFALGQFWAPAHFTWHGLAAFFLLSGNWYIIAFAEAPETITFLWSISVEEQFYLLWPTVMRRATPRGLQSFCLALAAAAVLCIFVIAELGYPLRDIWYNSLAECLFFAGGGLLAVRCGLTEQPKSGKLAAACLLASLASWVVADSLTGRDFIHATAGGFTAVAIYLLIAAGCAGMLYGFLRLPRFFIRPSLVYLGRISYGLYVFHGLALMVVPRLFGRHLPHGGAWLIFVLVGVVLMAALSYEFYEKPFLRWKHRFEVVHSRAA